MSTIDDDLAELENKITRLKLEYDQYFMGNLRREPYVLKGEIQKKIHQYLSQPPTKAREKFRFNTLCARYQSYRQLWARIIKEMEQGTYKGHRFRAQLREANAGSGGLNGPKDRQKQPGGSSAGVEKLYEALATARQNTGEGMKGLTREKLTEMVQRQTEELRRKHRSGKIRFKVTIEGKRARLRATVVRS
jgi:hypothetical protein